MTTERDVLDALRRRYTKNAGNGERYVLAEHVRDDGTFARRTADLLVRDLWRSSGLALHGFEVKCSRADWLTELRDPSKAHRFKVHCDYWWLAVSDADIVRDDLPEEWGLIVKSGDTMRVKVQAPKLQPLPMGLAMRASMERALTKTARRHMTLDAERGEPRPCERYISPWTCAKSNDKTFCWACRGNLAILRDAEAS